MAERLVSFAAPKAAALLAFCLLAAPARAQPTLLVLQKAGSSLGFYSPDGKPQATVPVGRHPHEMVLSADGRYLYTTDNGTMRIEQAGTGGNTVSVIDLAARKKVGEINLGEFRRPHGIDLIRSTGMLLVSTELPDRLLLIDPARRAIVRTFETQGKTAHMVTASADGKRAFVSNSSSSSVAAIELATGAVKLIAQKNRPEDSVLSRDGRRLYVANRDSNIVSIVDTEKLVAIGEIPTGRGPVRIEITPDGRYLVCALIQDPAVQWFDLTTRREAGRVAVKPPKEGLVSLNLSLDGGLAYASAQESDLVYVVSLAEKKVVRELKLPAGAGPDPVLEWRRAADR
ncbi:MAG: beta-propeller fold lactonase family protein [Bryobacteraceae bacterium]